MAGVAKGTFQERKEKGLEFIKFLEVRNLKYNIQTKESLKKIYNEQYKPVHKAEHPTDKFTNFGSVFHTLIKTGHVTLDKESVIWVDNPEPRSEGRRKNRMAAKFTGLPTTGPSLAGYRDSLSPEGTNEDKEDNISPRSDSSSTSRRRRGRRSGGAYKRNCLAVDQFVAMAPKKDNSINTDNARLPTWLKRMPNGYFKCEICKVICCTKDEMVRHLTGRRHRVQFLIHHLQKNREELICDKHNIAITSDAEMVNGNIRFDIQEKEIKLVEIRIKNNSLYNVVFKHCEMLKRVRVFTVRDKMGVTDGTDSYTIPSGSSYKVQVEAKARHVGIYRTPLAFQFMLEGDHGLEEFHIIRYLSARCTYADGVMQLLKPKSAYKPPPRVAINKQNVEIVDGLPLPRGSEKLQRDIPLEHHAVPNTLRRLVNRGLQAKGNVTDADTVELKQIHDMFKAELCADNHRKRFSNLLHMEEIQMEVDIRKYDMENVTMSVYKDDHRLLVLKVPGLAENRPSVLRGDWLFVQIRGSDGTLQPIEYKGYVHQTLLNEVALGFDRRLMDKFVPNLKFNVRFVFNRLPLRLQHRAVLLSEEHSLDHLLFPSKTTAASWGHIMPTSTKFRFYDKQLEENHEQALAVQYIVTGSSRPAPYIVFGPPGTGKTVTVVEAMKQVLAHIPSAHILACAPSNSAADLIVQRLLKHVAKKQVIRLNAFSRAWNTLPEDIKPVSNYDPASRQFVYPDKTDLLQFKVIVCTLVTAGRLASASFPAGHFTHVFVDEAGHAVEPEALIPVAGILESSPLFASNGGQLVLAGDPKQLGPILRSPLAIKYGLDQSLLERYMTTCDIYQKDILPHESTKRNPDKDQFFMKLVKNYRSHPDILYLPNNMFYEGELQVFADQLNRESLCHWEELPRKGFPLIFHGIIGEDQREERSPSFFNIEEISIVIGYVEKLLTARERGIKVKQEDIGIISPYRKQVQKLQIMLRTKKWTDIKVGSVEEFQGQERKVIIISTVRSNTEYLALDAQYKLGFLKNPKRFNVSITRSKALLIVVGNPNVLVHDKHWREFIDYCRQNGAYTGCDFDEDEDQLEDIMQRFAAMNLDKETDAEINLSASQVQLVEEPEWRQET